MNRPEMQARRFEALRMFQEGIIAAEVARKLGVARASASRWQRAIKERGKQSLLATITTGRPPRLSKRQSAKLPALLAESAWTAQAFRDEIQKRFGVSFHRDHVGRIMHRIGWRSEKK